MLFVHTEIEKPNTTLALKEINKIKNGNRSIRFSFFSRPYISFCHSMCMLCFVRSWIGF